MVRTSPKRTPNLLKQPYGFQYYIFSMRTVSKSFIHTANKKRGTQASRISRSLTSTRIELIQRWYLTAKKRSFLRNLLHGPKTPNSSSLWISCSLGRSYMQIEVVHDTVIGGHDNCNFLNGFKEQLRNCNICKGCSVWGARVHIPEKAQRLQQDRLRNRLPSQTTLTRRLVQTHIVAVIDNAITCGAGVLHGHGSAGELRSRSWLLWAAGFSSTLLYPAAYSHQRIQCSEWAYPKEPGILMRPNRPR